MAHATLARAKLLICTILFVASIAAGIGYASAATPSKLNSGITVAPAIVGLTINKGQDYQISNVGVKNNYNQPISLQASIQSVDQDQGILVPTNGIDSDLAKLISVSPANFNLQPNQSVTLRIRVDDSPKLGPGGNYAALVIKQSNATKNNLGLQTAVSVSLLITKEKGAIRELKASNLILSRLFFGLPKSTKVTFANHGNVHTVPRGIITVSDKQINTIYQKGVVNEASLTVFPTKEVVLQTDLNTIKHQWLPSKRVVTLQYRYDGSSNANTLSKSIWIVPNELWVIAVVLMMASGWLIRRRNKVKSRHRLKLAPGNKDKKVAPKPKKIEITDESDEQNITLRRS